MSTSTGIRPQPGPPQPEKAAEKGPVSRFFSAIFGWPARLTVPGQAAWLMALFLIIVVTTVWVSFLRDPDNVPWRHSMSIGHIILVIVLTITIPIAIYFAVRIWMQGEKSRFPDVDYAWQAGVDALRQNGLDLSSTPLFLVLGSASEDCEKALMDASEYQFRVQGVPYGPAPLHWYANREAIYLFVSEACWLSGLAEGFESRPDDIRERILAPRAQAPKGVVRRDSAASSAESNKTLSIDNSMLASLAAQARGDAFSSDSDSYTGTLESGEFISPFRAADSAAETDLKPVVLPPQESNDALWKLRHVCRLIRNERYPLCPINGALVLFAFDALLATDEETAELKRAVRADLNVMKQDLQLRFPVTNLVTGMERERGFRELVRRVGQKSIAEARFGHRYEPRVIPTDEQMTALAAHVCGAFEDWVYELFREADALTHPGNTRLHGLLCKVRSQLKGRLADLLSGCYGHVAEEDTDEPDLVNGFYFASTGNTEDRQAFVRGVLSKLSQEQENVEWSEEALRLERRNRRLIVVAVVVNSILAVSLIAMFTINSMSPAS